MTGQRSTCFAYLFTTTTDCYTVSNIYYTQNALLATKTFTIEKAYRWLVRYFYFVSYAQCAIDAFDEGKDETSSVRHFEKFLVTFVRPTCKIHFESQP